MLNVETRLSPLPAAWGPRPGAAPRPAAPEPPPAPRALPAPPPGRTWAELQRLTRTWEVETGTLA